MNRKVLVTAGGTIEPIDPVRYIGNRSSGRQGLAVAYEALRAGAEVTVIAGQTDYFELEGARVLEVETAEEMLELVKAEFSSHDSLVMSAAVADARPVSSAEGKIKKESFAKIELLENPDILATIGKLKRANQVVVGFAAETESTLVELGRDKLVRKGADLLYVNNVAQGAVFGSDSTSGALLSVDGSSEFFENVSKHEVARRIVNGIAKRLELVNG